MLRHRRIFRIDPVARSFAHAKAPNDVESRRPVLRDLEGNAVRGELRRVRQALKEARQTEAVAKAALEKLRTTKKPPPPPRQLGYSEIKKDLVLNQVFFAIFC